MKLKRAHILAVLALVAALGATGSVYQFYVKERLKELAEHQAEKEILVRRVNELKEKFSGTKPTVVLDQWKSQAQPWAETVVNRAGFFQPTEQLPKPTLVPEGKTAKFFYKDAYWEKVNFLYQELAKKGTLLEPRFDVTLPDQTVNPSAEEVEAWLAYMDAYTVAARQLVDANAIQIKNIAMWPPRPGPESRLGQVEFHTIGYEFTMRTRDLILLLDDLRNRRRYFNVDGFWIYNKTLRYPDYPLDVELLITQAKFVEREKGSAAPGGGAVIDAGNAFAGGGFGGGALGGGANLGGIFGGGDDDGGQFSRRAQPKPGIFKRILNLLPF